MYQNGGAARKYKPITADQARAAFTSYYADAKIARGPRKGQPRFATPLGAKRAMGYDRNHTKPAGRVVADSRYLRSPYAYDFQGVDTGSKVRKTGTAPSAKQLAARAAFTAMAKARSAAAKARKVAPVQTAGNALDAFNRYYAGPVVPKSFRSLRGMKAARTYDLGHTRNVTQDLKKYERNPHKWDFQGVDTGSKVRAAPTAKQVAARAQFAAMARARGAARTAAAKARKAPAAAQVAGGYWW